MSYIPFNDGDIFRNQLKTKPRNNIFIYDQTVYRNNYIPPLGGVGPGEVDLYELLPNTNTHPFITKQGTLTAFKSVSTSGFNSNFAYGDTLTGSYPLSASIKTERFTTGQTRRRVDALRSTFEYYRPISQHYAYSSSFGDKATQQLRLISIPSIYYGSKIDPGSVSLKFYITGILAAELRDDKQNGELRQYLPTGSNSGTVGGVVLYREGFIALTGTWSLHPTHIEDYDVNAPSTAISPAWIHFGTTGSTTPTDGTNVPSSSFGINFNGTQYTPVVTMLAHAKRGQLNFSHNPTFVNYTNSGTTPLSSSIEYRENPKLSIKNIVKTNFSAPAGVFNNVTYISKIAVLDKDKNLIAIAKLANPIRKREIDDYTFKLKIDL